MPPVARKRLPLRRATDGYNCSASISLSLFFSSQLKCDFYPSLLNEVRPQVTLQVNKSRQVVTEQLNIKTLLLPAHDAHDQICSRTWLWAFSFFFDMFSSSTSPFCFFHTIVSTWLSSSHQFAGTKTNLQLATQHLSRLVIEGHSKYN